MTNGVKAAAEAEASIPPKKPLLRRLVTPATMEMTDGATRGESTCVWGGKGKGGNHEGDARLAQGHYDTSPWTEKDTRMSPAAQLPVRAATTSPTW